MSTHVDAYLFALRRQTVALLRGDEPDGPHPLPRRDRALALGSFIAAASLGAVAVLRATGHV